MSADINAASSKELVQQAYQGEEVVLGRPDFLAQLMDTAPPVRWVQSTWAGVTPLIQHAYKDYVLTGVKGIFGQQMSEYVLTHLLAHEGRLRQRWQSQQSGLLTLPALTQSPLMSEQMGEHIFRHLLAKYPFHASEHIVFISMLNERSHTGPG